MNVRNETNGKNVTVTQAEIRALLKAVTYLKFECQETESLLYAGSESLNRLYDKLAALDAFQEASHRFYAQPRPDLERFIEDKLARLEEEQGSPLTPELKIKTMKAYMHPFPYSGDETRLADYSRLLPDTAGYSGEDWVQHITGVMYQEEHAEWIKNNWGRLPSFIRCILLGIDLDTELQMNGLEGLLNNSISCRADELTRMLLEIGLPEDARLVADLINAWPEENRQNGGYSVYFRAKLAKAQSKLTLFKDPDFYYHKLFAYAGRFVEKAT